MLRRQSWRLIFEFHTVFTCSHSSVFGSPGVYSGLGLARQWIHALRQSRCAVFTWVWPFFYVLLSLTVTCQFWFCLRSTGAPIFWETTSWFIPVFSSSWFDSGCMFMSFYGGVGLFTEFLREGGTRTLRSVRTWHADIISTAPRIWQTLVRSSPVEFRIMDFSGRRLLETFPYSALVGSTLDTSLRQFTEAFWNS